MSLVLHLITVFCLATSCIYSLSSPASLSSAAKTTFLGIDANDYSGKSISSAGDFNNDGFDDILIGAYNADPNFISAAGETYLIYGTNQPLGSHFDLSSLDGTKGITFNGIVASDQSGYSVSSAGDFNNDGFDDILIGALGSNTETGQTYLVFGTNQSLGNQFELSSLDGTNGIIFNGVEALDYSGYSVSSAGDFNNDGFDDILIGAYNADPNGVVLAGQTYLVFGTNSALSSPFDLSVLNGFTGITFDGIHPNDNSGNSVSSAGDFNNDGYDDILIGANQASHFGINFAGETYLIFGTYQFIGSHFNFSSLDGTNGVIFNGIGSLDLSGTSVSFAGDFNMDGFADILIGAFTADSYGVADVGETYLIFGTNQSLGAQFNFSSINGTNGIAIHGVDESDYAGNSVSSAGDFNNDGFDDILIGAQMGSPGGSSLAGESYVIFGTNKFIGAHFDISSINGANGIILEGLNPSDYTGSAVSSAGDFNNDGFDDILISSYHASGNAGKTYLVLGDHVTPSPSSKPQASNASFETLGAVILFICIFLF